MGEPRTGSHLPTLSALLPVLPVTNDPHFLEKVTLATTSAKGNETRCNFDVKVGRSPGVWGGWHRNMKGSQGTLVSEENLSTEAYTLLCEGMGRVFRNTLLVLKMENGTRNQGVKDASRN